MLTSAQLEKHEFNKRFYTTSCRDTAIPPLVIVYLKRYCNLQANNFHTMREKTIR